MSEFPVHSSDDQVGLSGPVEESVVRPGSMWLWPILLLVAMLNIILIFISRHIENESLKYDLVSFAGMGLSMLPLMPLVTLAQLGNRSAPSRLLALGYWGFLTIISVIYVGIVTFNGVIDAAAIKELPVGRAMDAVVPGGLTKVGIAIAFGLASALVGLSAFSFGGRSLAARYLPFDPSSFSSTTGLASVLVLLGASLIPLAVLNQPPLLLAIKNSRVMTDLKMPADVGIRTLYYQLVWAVPFAIVAAGYPLTRWFRASLERLGLGKLSLLQLGIAVGIAFGLFALMHVLGPAVEKIWTKFNWPRTDEKAFKELTKFAMSGAGAIAIGITAGVCEELAFRGLLQPRVGIFLSNLLFAAVHAVQYHWDALFIVFVIGFVCGIVRNRINTTAAIVVHGLYDILVVIAETANQIPVE